MGKKRHYAIRKITPSEVGRLQGVKEFDIAKMLEVNSNSQCYKQYGNSICVPVMMALFSQMNIQGIKKWNDMTDKERYSLIFKNTILEKTVSEFLD